MDVRIFFILAIGALVLVFVFAYFRKGRKQKRRERLRGRPLQESQIRLLEKNVPLYSRLPDDLQKDLIANMQIFLHEKDFFGRSGLQITEEIRLTVAGNACMLLLNRINDCFPGFRSILIYPQTYKSVQQHREGQIVTERASHRAGESWHRGPVILAWDDVLYGSLKPEDGFNVVLHEFAHKLDEENNVIDGAPLLKTSADYREWARIFNKDYQEFVREIHQHPDDAIDDYGATSPPEFFAVCTESFFEKPHLLREEWPDLYQQMVGYYRVDPAAW